MKPAAAVINKEAGSPASAPAEVKTDAEEGKKSVAELQAMFGGAVVPPAGKPPVGKAPNRTSAPA